MTYRTPSKLSFINVLLTLLDNQPKPTVRVLSSRSAAQLAIGKADDIGKANDLD